MSNGIVALIFLVIGICIDYVLSYDFIRYFILKQMMIEDADG